MSWGRLTGVRPVKTVRNMLSEGMSFEQASENFTDRFGVSLQKAKLCTDIASAQLKLLQDITAKDACIYIGIPFCKTRCLYCSFVTAETGTAKHLTDDFIGALIKEINAAGALVKNYGLNIVSIYIGGGTPTFLSSKDLTKLIMSCKIAFDLKHLREFTVEAGRPDTLDMEKLIALKNCGVSRICINPQSMNDNTLRLIGRGHTCDDIKNAFYLARSCGFEHINADVIAGLPSESLEDFKYTLDEVLKLSPESVTVHTLSVKRGSRLFEATGKYSMTNADTARQMVEYAFEFLNGFGIYPYYLYRQKNMLGDLENIGYARKSHECLYNIMMMEDLATVISLGGGGVTKVLNAETGLISRTFNVKEPREYIARIDEMISRKENLFLREMFSNAAY